MGSEYGGLLRVTAMKDNGSIIDSMVREFLSIEIAHTEENLKTFLNTAKVSKLL